MNIEIKTDEIDKKIKFKIDDEEYKEFNYESLDNLISKAMVNDNEVIYTNEEKLEDYESLIRKIIDEARSEDFKNAVNEIIEAKKKYEETLEN